MKINPVLRCYDSGDYGDRISLSLDGGHSWTLSLTPTGVRRFLGCSANKKYFTALDHGLPRVFKGSVDTYEDWLVIHSVDYHGVDVQCATDGESVIIATPNNWLLKVTPDGIFRYRYIGLGQLEKLGWPSDDQQRLLVLR